MDCMNKPISDSHELASKPPTNQTHMAGNLIDAATMLTCIFECGAGGRRGRVPLAVRRVCRNIHVCLAHTPLEQAIDSDGNGVVPKFVWELKRHL